MEVQLSIQHIIAIIALYVSIMTYVWKVQKNHKENLDKQIEYKTQKVKEECMIEIKHLERIISSDVRQMEKKIDELRDLVQKNQDKLLDVLSKRR